MPSQVEVCNRALGFLGQETAITSMTQDSKAARLCNRMFQLSVDAVVVAHPWNCAVVRSPSLAQNSTDPAFGYGYRYALPTNPYCLRVLFMKDEQTEEKEYKIEGRFLLCNYSSVQIAYIKRITNPDEFSPWLVDAVAARLAADIALALTGSSTQQQAMAALYRDMMFDAQVLDSQEGTPEQQDFSSWVAAREAGGAYLEQVNETT
uniref:Putative tail tubular protein n=1 Tax=viral metagenome TaxID=1070528 RepID=A0A6H1ZVR1_9ZZZZ